ncbi:MAG: squalene--hopene cyclase [Pararhizobium sp.]
MHEAVTAVPRDAAPLAPRTADLDAAIETAAGALRRARQPDGHWLFELEADATIPSEYVLFTHFLGEEADPELEAKIGRYLRRTRNAEGGWPLFHGGSLNISASVKAYFALKMIGDDPEAPHMAEARRAILAHGGAEGANVFTRILLALYGIVPWSSVPQMPVEIMLLPRWFPFHLSKISYWARTVVVPLLVLQVLKPKARNPRGVTIDELFRQPPATLGLQPRAEHQSRAWFGFFRSADVGLRLAGPLFPKRARHRAIQAALRFVRERLNSEDGLGAIFPAMVNAVLMFDALGYPESHPDRAIARRSIDKLLLVKDDEAYCQPCLSPIWDTALSCHALLEAGDAESTEAAEAGLQWLGERQELELRGDWAINRPGLKPGGWAFQYANPHYPDLDDTAVIVMAMDRIQREHRHGQYQEAISRAEVWIRGLQSRDGGWAAFDADNTAEYLNNIPFSDHGALLDPPSPDLTGRCVSMLAQLGETAGSSPVLKAGIDYLIRTQRPDGSWFGRWGINYIYGTWSSVSALNAAGLGPETPAIGRAAAWLISIQNKDGGWGESGESYKLGYKGHEPCGSSVSQTAWALLALMAAGRTEHPAVRRGVAYLVHEQQADGLWSEEHYSGTGFPRVFYLRYHGYTKYFPLWALARYRRLARTNSKQVSLGV